MILPLSFFLLIIISITSCVSGKPVASFKGKNIQVFEFITKHYEPAATELSKPFWDFKETIWFADSFAIEEIRQLNILEDSKGITCQSYDIRHYRFSDLRKQAIYEFARFNDTATLIRKYSYGDSVPVVGGWGFNYTRHWDYQGTTEAMPDTAIDNVAYKQAKIFRTVNNIPYIIFCYFNCDKMGTVFNLDPDLSKTIGCPLVKIYWSTPQKKGLHMTSELNFLSNSLTKEEQKVFTAWEKYAKENPVLKK
jgi:hypothetical protein